MAKLGFVAHILVILGVFCEIFFTFSAENEFFLNFRISRFFLAGCMALGAIICI
eukprot:NODE_2318_length_579_cov_15.632075_g1836_i0.p3 GENE.NODE_2318_length_579_cov_15.632075_g1836_i0~~NODE_2318_length_579_cov_15.632075_g1836_i0.p3  ORF type:complete len:54 (+),score=4.38 NODE_2318_length_579_cov_15.632075_g1836_i0:186-347(+)